MNRWPNVLIGLIGMALGFWMIYGFAGGCGSGYSEGTRTGVVVKLSNKGLVAKSWEGEMNLGSTLVDGNGVAVPSVWSFSIKDDTIAKEIENSSRAGKRVTLHYNQWLIRPWNIETPYVVDRVEK